MRRQLAVDVKSWRNKLYSNYRVEDLIDEYIHSARDRAILRDNLVDGLSYDDLAGKYGLAYESIKDIMRQGKAILDLYY